MQLATHKLSHSKVKPHQCQDCGSAVKLKEHLKRHVKSIHEGVRPHECSVCNKTFSHKGNLNKHLLIHKKDR